MARRKRRENWQKAIQHKQEAVLCVGAEDVWWWTSGGWGRGHSYGSPMGQQTGQTGGRGYGPSFLFPPPSTLQLCWAASRPRLLSLLRPLPPHASSSQVELLGSDMLQLLPQHTEGGPHHWVQGPALLH